MKLKIGGKELETLHCSPGGFSAHGLEGLEPRDRFIGLMEPPGGPSSEFTAQVTRVESDGARAVRFVEADLTTLLALQDNLDA